MNVTIDAPILESERAILGGDTAAIAACAEQNERDYKQLQDAVKSGQITADTGL